MRDRGHDGEWSGWSPESGVLYSYVVMGSWRGWGGRWPSWWCRSMSGRRWRVGCGAGRRRSPGHCDAGGHARCGIASTHAHRAHEGVGDRPAGGHRENRGDDGEPGVVVDPGDHLALPAIGQEDPADQVQLPQVHRGLTLPALVLPPVLFSWCRIRPLRSRARSTVARNSQASASTRPPAGSGLSGADGTSP